MNAKWKFGISVLAGICLFFVQFDVRAFASSPAPDLSISTLPAQNDRRVSVVVLNDGKPVEGASVVFTLPQTGAGGRFPDGSRRLTVKTDAQGRARSEKIESNSIAGTYDITVAASSAGLSASTTIHQSNDPKSAAGQKHRRKWLWFGAAAVGVAAAAILLAGHNESEPVVTVGAPTIGNPQ